LKTLRASFAAILFAALAAVVAAYTVPCYQYSGGPIVSKGWMDVDGVRHLSYSMSSALSEHTLGDVGIAVQSWNDRSASTGVVFDYTGLDNSSADVYVQSQNPATSCAETDLSAGTISISSYSQWGAENNLQPTIVREVEHEFGHVIGMDHASDSSSVMWAASYDHCTNDVVQNVLPSSTAIQGDDVTSGRTCAQSKMAQNYYNNGGGEETQESGGEDCWDYYLTQVTWYCDGSGCTVTNVSSTFLWSDCPPPN
jgi:hypothetical protein